MAEEIVMGTYRLNVLTFNGVTPDKGGAVSSGRLALIYTDGPNLKSATFRALALTASTRNPDNGGGVSASRLALLYVDSPNLKSATFRALALTASTRNPDQKAVTSGRLAFIIRPPTGFVTSGRLAFIINQQETGPAAFVPQTFMSVFQKEDWPTVSDTISTTRALQVFQKVVQKEIVPMPWSQTCVVSQAMEVLLQTPISFTQSLASVVSEVMQVLQSDIHEHVAVSMDYVLSQAMQVLQQNPLQMWQSPHYALSLAQWELYRTPMGFLPRSITTAYHTSLKVLQETPMGYLPWSDIDVHQVAIETLFDYTSPLPDQGTNEVRQETLLALQHTDGEPLIVGPNRVSQAAMQTVQASPMPMPLSNARAGSLAYLVLQETQYDPPADIGKTSAMQSVMAVAVEDKDYTHPTIMQSKTAVCQSIIKALQQSDPMGMWASPAIVPQAHIEWLQGANYPAPGDMIPPVNAALVSQLWIKTVQEVAPEHPQSETTVLQVAQLTPQYLFYPLASDLAEKGVFIGLFAEVMARNVVYPDPAEPISPAFVYQTAVITAYTDDTLPDPTKEALPGEVFQVVETVASGVEYPDPAVSQAWAEVSQTVVQKSSADTFPDPSVPVSSVTLTQISIQASIYADYLDPANLVSPADVSQAISQVSHVSTFPNPANPASVLTVDQMLQTVAIPDVTLYGVPDYAIKHRPIITISIVYIQAS